MPIEDGDYILVLFDERRKWLLKAEAGKEFHTHKGIIRFDDIIGQDYGHSFQATPSRSPFFVFRPIPSDFVVKMKRQTQIIYPEDIGLILMYTGIGPGKTVVEAGTGSGALTANLAYFVQPSGHIYTYDIRDKSLRQAKRNLEKMHLMHAVTIEKYDILEGIPQTDVDAIVLDLPTPWQLVDQCWAALKFGGTVCMFSPTIEQIKKNTLALQEHKGWAMIQTMELLKRDYQVKSNATRPHSRMIGHTGFMTFARKVERTDWHQKRQMLETIKKEEVEGDAEIPADFFPEK